MQKREDPTRPATIRLPETYWSKLRALMQLQGRAWLEKAIDREHTKRVGNDSLR